MTQQTDISVMKPEKRIFGLKPETLFQVFKYAIYTLIFFNVLYFLREEYLAVDSRFRNGIGWSQLIDAFSQFTDSLAWLVLLLIFELQTYVISDEKLRGPLKWLFNIVTAICYALIVQALVGYFNHMETIFTYTAYTAGSACAAVGAIPSTALDLYEFAELTASNCAALGSEDLFFNAQHEALTGGATIDNLKKLAVLDVLNATTWLGIILVLWIDIFLQMRGELTQRLFRWNNALKVVLYAILIGCCAYWGWLGDGIGFWDALLWILAFFFIELNLFRWHEETTEAALEKTGDTAGGLAS